MDDRKVVAAIAAGDPAGIAVAYDKYAPVLYGYCYWMLRQPTDAAEALQDTFVIAAATLGELPEAPELRPWLYAVARNDCLRRLRTTPSRDHAEEGDDAADQRADTAGQPVDVADQPTDATLQMRAVYQPAGATNQATDATLQMHAVQQPTGTTLQLQLIDATMPMRAVLEPTGAASRSAGVNDRLEQANLPKLVRTILAELKPREREVIELNLRHDLYDTDLAIALGVSWSRAHARAVRARAQLEKALAALLIARTGREACSELDALLADWDGQMTEDTRDLVGRHIVKCETCAGRKFGAVRLAVVSGLLPLAELPPELRDQVLMLSSSPTPDAVAYRGRLVRRAESKGSAQFSRAIKPVRLASIRGNPGMMMAAVAVVLWVVAAVSVTLLTLVGSHSSRAPTARPGIRSPASSPAAATASATALTSASASPSPTISPSPTYTPSPYVPSASPTIRTETSPSLSRSPTPSKSSEPSKSPSPSPSHSRSPSPSPSRTTSPSPSKTP